MITLVNGTVAGCTERGYPPPRSIPTLWIRHDLPTTVRPREGSFLVRRRGGAFTLPNESGASTVTGSRSTRRMEPWAIVSIPSAAM
jgi:hypothetical protein